MAGYKGKQGRKPIPTQLKVVRGTARKDRTRKDEPRPKIGLPPPPKCLSDEAKAEWERTGPILVGLRVMTEADVSAFALYCQAYGHWIEAEAKLAEEGTGPVIRNARGTSWVKNPWMLVAETAMAQMLKLLVEFGMTPSSRSRVSSAKPVESEDPVEKWMRDGRKRTP